MVIKFYIDKFVKNKAYPNLATINATPYTLSWRKFSTVSPYSEPLMLLEHMECYKIKYKIVTLDNVDNTTFYPIALSYFDFDINWFDLIHPTIIAKLKTHSLKILFYYSEGDNPYIIDRHITKQCSDSNVPREQVKFISANSEATNIKHFYHIVDDELLFLFRNKNIPPVHYHTEYRSKKFTALVRMHKFWRANIMSKLWEQNLHTRGYFGYGNEITANETENDNPIEVDRFGNLRNLTRDFLKHLPFKADNLTSMEHNTHTLSVREHFNSYLNIVIESHMDVDQSNGIFLTEKTFKPIKNAQLFIIFGPQNSLRQLKQLGYKTFDNIIDPTYDSISNVSNRWECAMNTLLHILNLNVIELHKLYLSAQEDIVYNQNLFLSSKKFRITSLIHRLQS